MKCIFYIFFTLLLIACKSNQLAVVKQGGKFGAIDRKGNFRIGPVWDELYLGEFGMPIVVKKDSLYGYINRKGEILTQPKFFDAGLYHEGLAQVANSQNKYGYINIQGDTIIDFKYEENAWGDFSKGLADVILNGKSGYIDKNGEAKIPLAFEQCYPFISDRAVVMDSALDFKLIDRKGNLYEYNNENIGSRKILPPKESYPGSIGTSTGQGRVNDKGDTIVPPIYRVTKNPLDHMYIVQAKNENWGAYNDKGRLIIAPQFEYIGYFHEGLAKFKLNGNWGFVNRKGKIVVEPVFEYANKFSNGIVYVEQKGKAGFINEKGKFVIQPTYESYPTRFDKSFRRSFWFYD